ncbi:hypothetical protein FQN54_007509 [Arachnomyces sp. PD_36]|nr:hypothetical protein FQN54_007509 [Arachnomyces sp. PD_36]
MAIREPEKGRRYIAALDTARCQGNWEEIPELVRKITKHTPWRKCLIQTATAEFHIASHINKTPAAGKPSIGPQPSSLSELIPPLLSSIEEENDFPQDIFQAQVCLGWVHWTLTEPALAALRLPKDLDVTMHDLSGDGQGISSWTEVCVIKAGFMKGTAQSLVSGFDEAIQTFNSVLPWLSGSSSGSAPQFLYWSEQLLAKGALMASQNVSGQGQSANEKVVEFALKSFRLWAAHTEVKRGHSTPVPQTGAAADHSVRTSIWMSYYELLSEIVQSGIPYIPPSEGPKRVHLSTEFRRVQTICENVLLKDVKFPKANSSNRIVEDWVEQVVQNWEVLHGPEWNDEDFGEGGQDAVARNVLDILYRAASKTFHSTLILRRLFHVHAAMSEFDLAMKALDSYIEIVTSAKDRAEKSAEAGGELEDDQTLLRTVSEGVLILCCFGSRKEAEKAEGLAEFLKGIVSSHTIDGPHGSTADGTDSTNSSGGHISPKILAMAYQAIGIGLANWSRWTPESECRDDIHLEAIDNLEKSLAPELQNQNVAATFALGLLLAETRDLDTAIDRIRAALGSSSHPSHPHEGERGLGEEQGIYLAERDRVPLWHLLALLLSARQEFETAGRSCEAAFEQFPSATVLFGSDVGRSAYSSREHVEKAHSKSPGLDGDEHKGVVDKMGEREKERIIEIRMTQLALTEALEGPEAALNHSDELLSLFARLYNQLGINSDERPNKENLVPPKSSAGTVKSTRGSMFGWRKGNKVSGNGNEAVMEVRPVANLPSMAEKDESNLGEAPAIQVTDEDQQSTAERPLTGRTNSLRHQDGRHKLQKRESVKHRPNTETTGGSSVHSSEPVSDEKGPVNGHQRLRAEDMSSTADVGMAISSGMGSLPTSPIVAKKMNHDHPSPQDNLKHVAKVLLRLPTNHRFDSPTWASTRFTKEEAQKHALTVLVKIWLLIAGLYQRASLFEDAREACEEASKQATRVETMTASHESSARAFTEAGFGGTKGADELRADICSERGCIALAQDLPFEALEHFEQAVMYWPDHAKATVKLSNLLLDIYEQTLPAEPPPPKLDPETSNLSLLTPPPKPRSSTDPLHNTIPNKPDACDKNPSDKREAEHLNRLAARDRAYGLLSTLTKLGNAWDNSEAWLAMARAYEAGEQIEKTKEVLWWCVELEDRRPIRHWRNLGSGGYVL